MANQCLAVMCKIFVAMCFLSALACHAVQGVKMDPKTNYNPQVELMKNKFSPEQVQYGLASMLVLVCVAMGLGAYMNFYPHINKCAQALYATMFIMIGGAMFVVGAKFRESGNLMMQMGTVDPNNPNSMLEMLAMMQKMSDVLRVLAVSYIACDVAAIVIIVAALLNLVKNYSSKAKLSQIVSDFVFVAGLGAIGTAFGLLYRNYNKQADWAQAYVANPLAMTFNGSIGDVPNDEYKWSYLAAAGYGVLAVSQVLMVCQDHDDYASTLPRQKEFEI